jgi:hypothetical protein
VQPARRGATVQTQTYVQRVRNAWLDVGWRRVRVPRPASCFLCFCMRLYSCSSTGSRWIDHSFPPVVSGGLDFFFYFDFFNYYFRNEPVKSFLLLNLTLLSRVNSSDTTYEYLTWLKGLTRARSPHWSGGATSYQPRQLGRCNWCLSFTVYSIPWIHHLSLSFSPLSFFLHSLSTLR